MKNNLPSPFISHLEKLLGNEAEELINSFSSIPPVSIRINPLKNYFPPGSPEKIPWSDNGFYLAERPVFTLDPAFHAGAYYVQEAGSMFLEQAIKKISNPDIPVKILDISAAPGGKSTHLLSLLPENSLLVANEVIRSRAEILKENIIKWGFPNVIVTSSDPEKFSLLENFFDVIVVDAPCSGEGLFRKDKNAVNEWSQENVNLCTMRQKRILNNCWSALKSGGYLIYSTCTFQPGENELQLASFIKNNDASPVKLEISNNWKIETTETIVENKKLYGYRFYPHKIKSEGFFLSVIKKKNNNTDTASIKIKKKIKEINSETIQKSISRSENLILFDHNASVFAFPRELVNELNFLLDKINIIYAGVETGKFAGKNFIPAHALALSTIVSDQIPSVDLTNEEAIKYLKKSELKLKTDNTGWKIVKFNDLNLGWIKVLQNRINNYYPKEYRIRM